MRVVEYEAYYKGADDTFHKIFVSNTFGHVCDVCDRIWFKLNLSLITVSQVALLEEEFVNERALLPTFKLCSACRQALNAKKVPSLSRSNSCKCLEHPTHVPPLDPITERLISPRLPFMLVGDLNLNVSTNENAGFLDFMHMFDLRLASTTAPTTIGGSCIDRVFIRNLDGLRCSRHISYFSYHRPLLAVYDYESIESTQCSDLAQNK
jgi:hypothetical protein